MTDGLQFYTYGTEYGKAASRMEENQSNANGTGRNGAAGSGDGRDGLGRFRAGNSGRPKGSRNKASIIASKLLRGESGALARKAVELALQGDVQALRLAMQHILPPIRSQSERVRVPGLREASTPSEQARAIVAAAARGAIGPDTASQLLGAMADAAKICEIDELSARIAALEARHAA